jgi:predicted porin
MKYTATTLLALACCSAHAQSSVQVYGVADAGIVLERGGAAGNTTNVSSGVASGSRIGFKGTEDLGNGLSAGFVVESGFAMDTGASGQAANLMVPNRRMDNSLRYASPKLAGFSTELAYSAGEVAGDSTRKRALSGALNYDEGPLALSLSHFRRESATAGLHAHNTLLAARYKLGAYQLHAGYAFNRGMGTVGGGGSSTLSNGTSSPTGTVTSATSVITAGTIGIPGASSRDLVLGLCATFGPHSFAGSVVQHMDRSAANQDARQYGIAYLYGLSKRTDLYAAYGRINGHNGAPFTVGNATDDGKGQRAFNLGLRHQL